MISEMDMEVFGQMINMVHGRHIKRIDNLPKNELSYVNILYMIDRNKIMKPFYDHTDYVNLINSSN